MTPSKPPTDSSKPFQFQFGPITPGFMNGIQIPRTSSAPRNLDEQKRDQARNDALKPAPYVPAPVPKQQVPRKDMSGSEQPNTVKVHPVPKTKKDSQVSPAPQMNQSQKPSVLPHPMTSVPMSYHQPQVAMQFGGPNPQIQSQGVSAASLQMQVPMPLQMGNAPLVQQPVFVQGLQHHPMQPPGMMHQGQGLRFAIQMGPQLPHQLGNKGIGMAPQYAQQQGGKFGGGQSQPFASQSKPATSTSADKNLDQPSSNVTPAQSGTVQVTVRPPESASEKVVDLPSTASRSSAGRKDQQFASVPTHDNDASAKHDGEVEENAGGTSAALAAPSSKHVELARSKSKKKRREILQKADAQGTTSDLYMAYKGPEEKKEIVSSVVAESNSTVSSNLKQAPDVEVEPSASKKGVTNKTEPDDWEDAADVSTPKLEASDNGERAHRDSSELDRDGNSNGAKKYSRDFLLKFSEQFTALPENFVNIPDLAGVLISTNVSHLVDRDSYPSPGRVIDRSSSGSRMDRRGNGIVEDDRWSKLPSPFVPGRDTRVDIAYGAAAGLRPGQAGNFGVLRNPRAQGPVQYAGGILAGPMQERNCLFCMAYKGPEKKKEIVSSVVAESNSKEIVSSVVAESNSTVSSNVKQAPDVEVEPSASKKGVTNKTEPDDWEDAADVSTPKLEASDNGERAHGDLSELDKDGNSNRARKNSIEYGAKKYSRNFLLKFSEQFTNLPENFVNIPDLAGLRPGRAGNFGVLRNPRAQGPVQYAGGILAGPMQSMGPRGGVQRNSPDSERWQDATNFQQKGLIPSPQTPLQVMHKAERKYEGGKVAEDAAIREQAEENPEEYTSLLEPRVDSANASTFANFLEAYGETPEALIERLLSLDTDLLAFSHVLFAPQMTALLEFLTKLNTNDDDYSQELAIRAVEETRRIGYNLIKDSFKLASPKFSLSEETKLQQGIRDQEQKLVEIDQSLPAAEQKLEEAKNRVTILQAELAEAEAEVARCQEGVTALTREKAAISGSISANRLSVRSTNICARTRAFVEGPLRLLLDVLKNSNQ